MKKLPGKDPSFGDVYWIDLTPHTNPSQHTIKGNHPVVVIQSSLTFPRPYPNVIVLPCTSFDPKTHWDNLNQRLKYKTHFLLQKSKYSKLKNDTIVKCEQIFTIGKHYLQSGTYWFTIDINDMREILKRVTMAIGFSDLLFSVF